MTGNSAGIPEDAGLLIALKRVANGQVFARGADLFTERGRPFPRVLAPFVRKLFEHGHARVAESGDEHGTQQVLITLLGEGFLLELEVTVPNAKDQNQIRREREQCME